MGSLPAHWEACFGGEGFPLGFSGFEFRHNDRAEGTLSNLPSAIFHVTALSSNGLGRSPLKAEIRVRFPLGLLPK